MKTRYLFACLLAISFSACAGQAKKGLVLDEATLEKDYHRSVEMDYVKSMIDYPMPENRMIVDSRPLKPKYVEGHIPGAVSLPDTYFDKMANKLPKDKAAQLVFYCGGLQCRLSHKSAWRAEALGYTNVAVYAKGYPDWISAMGNYPSVTAAWVKEQLAQKGKIALIDSRPAKPTFEKGHIPGAINIPDSQFDKMKARLPRDKSKTLVFYCGGHHCKLSHNSAVRAIELGYKNVMVFSGGFPEWQELEQSSKAMVVKPGLEKGTMDHAFFRDTLQNHPESLFLVDVRDASEHAKGAVKGSVNIPVGSLEKRVAELPADKAVVFYCGAGARSGEAYYMIQDIKPALKNVYYLDGTMTIAPDGAFTMTRP